MSFLARFSLGNLKQFNFSKGSSLFSNQRLFVHGKSSILLRFSSTNQGDLNPKYTAAKYNKSKPKTPDHDPENAIIEVAKLVRLIDTANKALATHKQHAKNESDHIYNGFVYVEQSEMTYNQFSATIIKGARLVEKILNNSSISLDQLQKMLPKIELNEYYNALYYGLPPPKVNDEEVKEKIGLNPKEGLSREALGWEDLMTVYELNDELRENLMHLQVLPPLECNIPGSKPFTRKSLNLKEAIENDGDKENEESVDGKTSVSEENKQFLQHTASFPYLMNGLSSVLLDVKNVKKMTRGGKLMSVRAVVGVGNGKGLAGVGMGKGPSSEVAISKATMDATKNLVYVPRFQDRTIPYPVSGKYVRSQVKLWPKPQGGGLKASFKYVALLELCGIKDAGSKAIGSRNVLNSMKALMKALSTIKEPEELAARRGKSLADINQFIVHQEKSKTPIQI